MIFRFLKKFDTLFGRFFLTIAPLLILSYTILFWNFSDISSKAIFLKTKTNLERDTQTIMHIVDREFSGRYSDLEILSKNPIVIGALRFHAYQKASDFFKQYKDSRKVYSSIEIYDLTGELQASSSYAMLNYLKINNNGNQLKSTWFQDAKNGNTNHTQLENSPIFNSYIISFYRPVLHPMSGEVIGVLRIVYAWKHLFYEIKKYEQYSHKGDPIRGFYLLDKKTNRILYSPNQKNILSSLKTWQLSPIDENLDIIKINNKEFITAKSKEHSHYFFRDLGWFCIGTHRTDNILRFLSNFQKQLIITSGAISIVIILIVALLLMRLFVSPIKSLLSSIKKVTKVGKFDEEVKVYSTKEIRDLVESFNEMGKSLEKYNEDVKKVIAAEASANMAKKSREYIENIFRSLSEMLFVLKKDGTIQTVNQKIYEILNYQENDIVGEHISKIIIEDENEENHLFVNFKKFQGVITQGEGKEIRGFCVAKSQEKIPVIVSGTLMKDTSEIIISAKDVRESKIIQELKNKQSQIIQSAKYAAIGEMVGGVAHEINNPLGIIQADAEMISELITDDPIDVKLVKKMCKEMSETIFRISDIIKSLKVISREGTNDPFLKESFSEILKEAIILCSGVCKKNDITLDVSGDFDDLIIECRSTQIIQVFMNLIRNSIDAIGDLDNRWIKIDVQCNERNIEICFTDSGKGIPKSIQRKIFHPFYTTKEVGHGTGLGLSVVKKVIESHNGSVWIDNTNPNTCFMIKLHKNVIDLVA